MFQIKEKLDALNKKLSTYQKLFGSMATIIAIINFLPKADVKIHEFMSIFEPKVEVSIDSNQSTIPPRLNEYLSIGINDLSNQDLAKKYMDNLALSPTQRKFLDSYINMLQDEELYEAVNWYKQILLNGFDLSVVTIKNNSEEYLDELKIYLKGISIHDIDCHRIDNDKHDIQCAKDEIHWVAKNNIEIITIDIPSKEAYEFKLYGDAEAIDIDIIRKGNKIDFKLIEIIDIEKDFFVRHYAHNRLRFFSVVLILWLVSIGIFSNHKDNSIEREDNDDKKNNNQNTIDNNEVQKQLNQDDRPNLNLGSWKERIFKSIKHKKE